MFEAHSAFISPMAFLGHWTSKASPINRRGGEVMGPSLRPAHPNKAPHHPGSGHRQNPQTAGPFLQMLPVAGRMNGHQFASLGLGQACSDAQRSAGCWPQGLRPQPWKSLGLELWASSLDPVPAAWPGLPTSSKEARGAAGLGRGPDVL